MAKIFKVPFAETGDKTVVPVPVQADGSVSWTQGYGFDYQRPLDGSDPLAKPFPRNQHNQILNDITSAIGEIQINGYPLWSADATPYPINAQVRYGTTVWRSAIANNSATPGVGVSWVDANLVPQATETVSGIAKVATQTQTNAGTDDTTIVTPKKLKAGVLSAIGFTPVQQGGGTGQGVNKLYIGWDNASKLLLTVENSDKGAFVLESTVATESSDGIARIATTLEAATGTSRSLIMTPATVKEQVDAGKLSFVPVQQGGGPGQSTNKINIGWGNQLKLLIAVDGVSKGSVILDTTLASETVSGIAKVATQVQTNAGADDTTIVTPKKLKAGVLSAIGYTPVQQGGGIDQEGNKLNIGWGIVSGSARLLLTVDDKQQGPIVLDSNVATETAVGVARIATFAEINNLSQANLMMTPRGVQEAIKNRPIGDTCSYVGFAGGDTTLPYMRHTTLGVIGVAPLLSPSLIGSPKAPTQAVESADTTLATTAFVLNAINFRSAGRSQAWSDFTASRALSTTYTNTTTRPIMVAVSINDVAGAGSANISIAGVAVSSVSHGSNNFGDMTLGAVLVPVGATYRVESTRPISRWTELR